MNGATAPLEESEKLLDIETQLAWDAIIASSDLLHTDLNLAPPTAGQETYSEYENSSSLQLDAFQTIEAVDPTLNNISEATTSRPPDHETCLCSRMLEVYETAEVGLAQAQRLRSTRSSTYTREPAIRSSTNSDEELRCQKDVLKSCEMWLSRDASRLQSKHAMLMASILDRLLTSILMMGEPEPCRKDTDGQVPISPVSPDRSSTYTGGRKRSFQEIDYTLQTHHWEEDDEDEERMHVLRSLLNFRASRLKGLLERLGAIAASNQWQMQTSMVHDMLERLNKRGGL